MRRQPRRTLADWTPDHGPEDEWIKAWAAQGMIPEHGYGVDLDLGGRSVKRWALIERSDTP